MTGLTDRELLQHTVAERAKHNSEDEARDTWSFARAERLLGKEYYGRFLIELLQNATDAWRQQGNVDSSCELVILIDESPAVVVANRGEPFPVETVLKSLGQIGQSSKKSGEAIGHKGIGFKSVLEVSDTPEIYSDFANGSPTLAVCFDAGRAWDLIAQTSPQWDEWVRAEDEFAENPLLAVPVLRYPLWVDDPPVTVKQLSEQGYDTIVRLPFRGPAGEESAWRAKVQTALEDVSDQILVLLGIFERVRIEDAVVGRTTEIVVETESAQILEGGVARERVRVRRNDQPSSIWLRYRQGSSHGKELASETTFGIRLDVDDPRQVIAAHGDPTASSPFHLYFPTFIGSGLPFLLHGYFEVDAGRTGFYRGSVDQNEAVLERLARLVVVAIADASESAFVDLRSLANLVSATPSPETREARQFLDAALEGLDHVSWIPTATELAAPPVGLLLADRVVIQNLVNSFPVDYLREVTGLAIPDPCLDEAAFAFLHHRKPGAQDDFWSQMGRVLRPGNRQPWNPDASADDRFRELMCLIEALQRLDPSRANALLQGLAGDPDARLIPVALPDGVRYFVPIPNPDATVGRRSSAVMARIGSTGAEPLIPPEFLDIHFVADGLLTSGDELDRAKPLGLRPFTVDAVLDRLSTVSQPSPGGDAVDERRRLIRFLWDLMSRERRSEFGTASGSRRALSFASPDWFWMRAGIDQDDVARARLRRQRNLAQVLLPARNGSWAPAGTLVFGADWGRWLDSWPADFAQGRRRAAMERLERLAPGERCLLASPADVLSLLPAQAVDPDEEQSVFLPLEQLAFLLRLGCWEVPPVVGHETRTAIGGVRWPWPQTRRELGDLDEPWNFDASRWMGNHHRSVTVTQDTKLAWPLERWDLERQRDMTDAISDGAALYTTLGYASAMCPGCSTSAGNSHGKTYRTEDAERRPSTLALQLRRTPWVPAARGGHHIGADAPVSLWWDDRALDINAMRTSPLQHLSIAEVRDWSAELRALCHLLSVDEAEPQRLLDLHQSLRTDLQDGRIDLQVGTARQSFLSLHRMIYERLVITEVLPDDFEVLCELGSDLVYRRRSQCRHDDGRFVGYTSRFGGRVAFVALARDKQAVAKALGVDPFVLSITRRGSELGEDITFDLHDELTDRIPEILALMVHYGSGSNTLDPTSQAFSRRANSLTKLRVRRVDNLVLDVCVADMPDVADTIGFATRDDSYLDTSQPGEPTIYHDMTGDGWRGSLRRRLGVHLAVLGDVAALSDTFTLLLTASESDREDLLQSWGVTATHIQEIRSQLGIVSEIERSRMLAWRRAVLAVLELSEDMPMIEALLDAGLSASDAEEVDWGPATSETAVLAILASHGVDLRQFSQALVNQGEPPLRIHVARDRLRAWLDSCGAHLAAVLSAGSLPEDDAKDAVGSLSSPAECDFLLDPTPTQFLEPVVVLLRQEGFYVEAEALAESGTKALADLVGLSSADLDERARELFDAEARQDRLLWLTRAWARELRLLSLLATHAGSTASAIRSEGERLDQILKSHTSPAGLAGELETLLPGDRWLQLRAEFAPMLADDLPGKPPVRESLLEAASSYGMPMDRAPAIDGILAAPRNHRVTTLNNHIRALKRSGVSPVQPLIAPQRSEPRRSEEQSRKPVNRVTVDANADRRKKQLGDEAENWALAALVTPLLELESAQRCDAIRAMLDFLDTEFKGPAVEELRDHAHAALNAYSDDEELLDHLRGFMHAASVSDMFGFDMLAWLSPGAQSATQSMAVEVKSASAGRGGSFYLSRGEWKRADELRAEYAVLVVGRSSSGEPSKMDLLVDPVWLVESGQLGLDPDTYRADYGPAGHGKRGLGSPTLQMDQAR